MKRPIRLPRSNEGGMLLDMPHAAYRGGVPEIASQRVVSALPLSHDFAFASIRPFT